MGNFDHFPRQKNEFFHHQDGPEYDKEKQLFDLVSTECINFHGVCCKYYKVSWNKDFNAIWGEDSDRFYERTFDFMSMYELPIETGVHGIQGFNLQDQFHIYVTFIHFAAASSVGGEEIEPSVGDVIQSNYDHRFWEIVNVDSETRDMHLQTKHAWDITVIPWINEHIGISADVGSTLQNQVSATDIFDVSDVIDQKATVNKYNDQAERSESSIQTGNW